jgi:hypothetical protein
LDEIQTMSKFVRWGVPSLAVAAVLLVSVQTVTAHITLTPQKCNANSPEGGIKHQHSVGNL